MKNIVLSLVLLSGLAAIASPTRFQAHRNGVWKIKFSPEGTFFLTTGGDGIAKMWWTDCLCGLTSFKHDAGDRQVYDADFFPDGRVISSSLDGTVYVWFRETGEVMAKIEGHEEYVSRVRVSKDGSHFFTGSADDHVRIYDSKTYKMVGQVETKSPVGIVPLGGELDKLLTLSLHGVTLWNLADAKAVKQLSESPYYFAAEPVSATEVLIGGNPSQGGPLEIWDMEKGKPVTTFDHVPGFFWNLAVSPNGEWVGGSTYLGRVYVWDRKSGRILFTSSEAMGKTMSLAFFPEGRALLIGNAAGQVQVARF